MQGREELWYKEVLSAAKKPTKDKRPCFRVGKNQGCPALNRGKRVKLAGHAMSHWRGRTVSCFSTF